MSPEPVTQSRFHEAYSRPQPAYGEMPSPELQEFLEQCPRHGRALDLGAGAGRDTIALARRGLLVTALDSCPEGLKRVLEAAERAGVENRVAPRLADVRTSSWPAGVFDVVVATTLLDHLSTTDARAVWSRAVSALHAGGVLYVEVHTTDDPGSPVGYGAALDAPQSETADQVVHHFAPGELLAWATADSRLRVLRYEERFEWDYTHGPIHQHAKSVLLATTRNAHPAWYGAPPAFPYKGPRRI